MNAAQGNTLIRQAMSLLGSRKSKTKSAAARRNGRKGGRPKGATIAARVRAKANTFTPEKRQRLLERGMAAIEKGRTQTPAD